MDVDAISASSAWSAAQIEKFLQTAVLPCRLGCVSSAGFPMVTSLWYLYADNALHFSVQESSRVVGWLRANPRCGFEVAGDAQPYRGVRGHGYVSLHSAADEGLLQRLLLRYDIAENSSLASWLLSRLETEVSVRLQPRRLTSWDYSSRMAEGET